jgi:hypothetical protein
MESLSGVKLLSSAMVFGAAAVIFTTLPFLLVIMRGIVRSRDRSTGGGNFLGVVLLAMVVHVMSTIAYMGTILILDVFGKMNEERFFSETVLGIFWAQDKASAFAAAGISENSNEALGAWTTLFTVKTVVDILFICIPIIVVIGGIAYGISLSTKDTYRQDYITVMVYSGLSMVSAMVLYTAWALIASQGLFLPYEYDGLLGYISETWRSLLL